MEEEKKEKKIWHSPDEEPEFYTDHVIKIEDDAVLVNEHSKYYKPTKVAKQELQEKLKKFKRWAYLNDLLNERQ